MGSVRATVFHCPAFNCIYTLQVRDIESVLMRARLTQLLCSCILVNIFNWFWTSSHRTTTIRWLVLSGLATDELGESDQGQYRRVVRHQRLTETHCWAEQTSALIAVSVHVLSLSYLAPTHLGLTAASHIPKPCRRLVRKVNLISASPLKRTARRWNPTRMLGEAQRLGEPLYWHEPCRPRSAESLLTILSVRDAILQLLHNGITAPHGIRYRRNSFVMTNSL